MTTDPTIGTTALEAFGALLLICTGILVRLLGGIKTETQSHGEKLARIETVLTGANGENGLNGDVKTLRERTHAHGNDIHALRGNQQVFELRLDSFERRVGPDDRRQPT